MKMEPLKLPCVILLTCLVFTIIDQSDAGRVSREWGHKGYIEYRHGSPGTHLIITSVHAGCMEEPAIPPRQNGCYDFANKKCSWHHGCFPKSPSKCPIVTVTDRCTLNLATTIAQEWEDLTGNKPHMIISHVLREKFDGNREKGQAAQENSDLELAWDNLHQFITTAKEKVTKNGIGLLVDIHGQAHTEEWVELGYGITSDLLNKKPFKPQFSYIQNAVRLSNHSQEEVLRGEYSLGKFLQDFNHDVIPSPKYSSPNGGKYFAGGDLGYITWLHGSRLGGDVDSILVESPTHLRTPMATVKYAEDFVSAVRKFAHANYGADQFD